MKLDQFLKWQNLVSSGGEAKFLIKSGSIKESKSLPLSEIVNMKDNTFLNTKKLRDIFNSRGINSNKIVMSCGSSVSAASLALAYSLINDDYIPKIYIGSWTEFGKL